MAASCTARVMVATTASLGACGFSLTLSRTGTSSCGAPYGSTPASSGRSGSRGRPATEGGVTPPVYEAWARGRP
ncbi:Uncharacterised protein [Mycobacteroides abscessus]|nr:Uncharacterised protein [Mycobacteroides abscessus]